MPRNLAGVALSFCLLVQLCVCASELVEALPLTDRIVTLHFNDGHVEHHLRGQSRSDEKVMVNPLDTAAASKPSSYSISSPDDPRYAAKRNPKRVGRKSKGADFAWFVDKWENGHAVAAEVRVRFPLVGRPGWTRPQAVRGACFSPR
jgi:hypothetical protein